MRLFAIALAFAVALLDAGSLGAGDLVPPTMG